MRDWASELRAIADGRLMLNVRNGVTVSRSMLAMIADEIDALRAAPLAPAEVGGHADAQTEARAIAAVRDWLNGGCSSWGLPSQQIETLLTALAAKDAELAELREAKAAPAVAYWRSKCQRAEAQLAEANKALDVANELEVAGHVVLCELNARIDAAPSTAKPVFNGIADLHDALGRFRAVRAARRAREQGGK